MIGARISLFAAPNRNRDEKMKRASIKSSDDLLVSDPDAAMQHMRDTMRKLLNAPKPIRESKPKRRKSDKTKKS